MQSIRNAGGRLVAVLDEQAATITIRLKGYETKIVCKPDGSYEIINSKPTE